MQSRVLVIDDDPSACNFIRDVLSHSTSMEVLAFTDGSSADDALAAEKFAVIVLDQHMPPPDGLELAQRIRKAGLNQMTPIIMISDDASTAAVSRGFAAGAQFFLYKPIDKMRLLRLVRATHGAIEHERRRFRRVSIQTRVRLQVRDVELDGQTIDLSLNGMLVQANGSCAPDSQVRVSLFVPNDAKPITCTGSVVRSLSGNRLGIQLNQLPFVEGSRLQDFLLPILNKEEAASATDAVVGKA
jgi:DNA-binding response OmpR family regulator